MGPPTTGGERDDRRPRSQAAAIEHAKADIWSDDHVGQVDPVVRARGSAAPPSWPTDRQRAGRARGRRPRPLERVGPAPGRARPRRPARPGLEVRRPDRPRHRRRRPGSLAVDPVWLRRRAEGIGLQPGGVWHERTSGTNGIGLALAADRPVTVFATEHWLNLVQDWVCYAAPVHAPDGAQVGAIDLSTTWSTPTRWRWPPSRSMARLVEHELRLRSAGRRARAVRPRPAGARRAGRPPRRRAAAADAAPARDPHHPGLTRGRPRSASCTPGSTATGPWPWPRSRPRCPTCAGPSAASSRSRPYRPHDGHRVDAVRLLERLDVGDVDGAARLYGGQLLPTSEAPFLVEHRRHLDVALRTALLRQGTASGALRYTAVHPYDTEVLEQARRVPPATTRWSPRWSPAWRSPPAVAAIRRLAAAGRARRPGRGGPAGEVCHELAHQGHEAVGVVVVGEVAGAGEDLEPAARAAPRVRAAWATGMTPSRSPHTISAGTARPGSSGRAG